VRHAGRQLTPAPRRGVEARSKATGLYCNILSKALYWCSIAAALSLLHVMFPVRGSCLEELVASLPKNRTPDLAGGFRTSARSYPEYLRRGVGSRHLCALGPNVQASKHTSTPHKHHDQRRYRGRPRHRSRWRSPLVLITVAAITMRGMQL
jgi:hypothetical protein